MRLSGKVAANAAALGGARMANALLGLVGVGITTSYLGVEGYGSLVVGLAFVTVIGTLNDLGIGTIVAREVARRPDEARRLVNAGFTLVLGLSVVGALIGIGLMFVIYPGGGREMERQAIVLLLVIPLPLAAAGAASSTWFIARQRAWVGGLGALVGAVLSLGALILAVALDLGFTGVVCAYALQAMGFGLVMIVAARRLRLRPGTDRALSMQLLRWAIPMGGALLVTSMYQRIDLLLLSLLGSTTDAGIYGLAYRFADALLLLPTYMTITLLPEFSRLREERRRVGEIVQKAVDVMVAGVAPLVVVFVVFATPIATLLGGGEFEESGQVLAVLMLGVGLGFVAAAFVEPIVALGHQKWILWETLTVLVANVVLNLLLIPPYGAVGAAVAFLCTEALMLVILAVLFARLAPAPVPREAWRVAVAAAAMAGVGVALLEGLRGEIGSTPTLLVGAPLAALVYVAVLYAVRGVPAGVHETFVRPLAGRLRQSRSRA